MSRWLAPALLVCAGVGGGAPQAAASTGDWPMVRHDPHNSAFTRLKTASPVKRARAWQFQASSHVWGYQPGMTVWSSPALGLVAGRPVVLVGSYDHNLYCLDARSGARIWRFTTGGGIYSAPALWHAPDGRSLAFVAASDRMVYALDAELGRREWVHAIHTWRPTIGGARLSSPAVGRVGDQPALFVGHWVWDKSLSGHLQAGGLTALDALTGRRLWTTALGDNQLSSPIFVGDRVYVASENGNLYALDAKNGQVLWTRTDRNAIKASPALFRSPAGPRVVIGSKFGAVRCLDADNGNEVWFFKTAHWVDGAAAIAEVGGRQVVLVGSYDTQLYALNAANGSPLWTHRTAGGIYASPALAPDGQRLRVLVSSWDHHLHCVAAEDGSLLWSAFLGRPIWDSISLGDSIWSSAAVAEIDGQQVAYVGSYAGPFYAIPLAEAAEKALARPGSNIDFWVSMPVVLLLVAGATVWLTRRHRRRQRERRTDAG